MNLEYRDDVLADQFLGKPLTKRIRPGWSRVAKAWRFASKRVGAIVTVPQGFEFDWDSVPRIPGVHAALKGRAETSALAHDYLYYAGMFSRKTSDQIMLDLMVVEGVAACHRWAIYMGVRLGGRRAWRRHRQ